MNLVLDFLSEMVPRFRTETYAFVVTIDSEEGLEATCLGRLVDLDDETDFDITIDVSSFGWLFFRAFRTYRKETYKDYSKGDTNE